MIGVVLILIVLLVAIPVGILVTTAIIAMALGTVLRDDGVARNEGSELVALNR